MAERCSTRVFGPRVFSWQCNRRATVECEGKWYCWQHDPVRMKEKAEEDEKRYRRSLEMDSLRYKRREAEEKACAGVPTEDLRPGMLRELLDKE